MEKRCGKIRKEYNIPMEVHSPMEMHGTIAVWDGDDKLTVYDKNHAVKDVQRSIANIFGIKTENVFVQAEFIGGGFGSGLRVWPHCIAAIIAAKTNRPVKVTLTRPQMFTMRATAAELAKNIYRCHQRRCDKWRGA